MPHTTEIQWPDYYHPQKAPVHVRNELDMSVSPELVWQWLIRAVLWPKWYENSADVRLLNGQPDLHAGCQFQWRTFGVSLKSTVLEYVPGERIAWNAKCFGVDAYHAWLIKTTDHGCYVLTEETQYGWLARLGNLFLPKRMSKYHQLWLESMAAKAASGAPPAA